MKNSVLFLSLTLFLLAALPARAWDLTRLAKSGVELVQSVSISNSDIQALSLQSVQQMDAGATVASASDPYSQRLAKLTKGLTQVNGVPLNFKVYKTTDVNAFACPDGSVRVYTGIMDMMTDDELLGIIGHEIGHVAKQHSRKAYKQQLFNAAILDAAGSISSTAAALTDSQLMQVGSAYVSSKYSRSQESEADDYGYDFLKANGKNPYVMALAFQKMLALESSSSSSAISNMFSSHPTTQSRIKKIQKRCKKDGFPVISQ